MSLIHSIRLDKTDIIFIETRASMHSFGYDQCYFASRDKMSVYHCLILPNLFVPRIVYGVIDYCGSIGATFEMITFVVQRFGRQ